MYLKTIAAWADVFVPSQNKNATFCVILFIKFILVGHKSPAFVFTLQPKVLFILRIIFAFRF